MSSTNKTEYLGLNSWLESDRPKREDFNNDNALIDRALKGHLENHGAHVTPEDKTRWESCVHYGVYFGDGDLKRTIETNCPFTPKALIVYASGKPLSSVDFPHSKKYNYFAASTGAGDTMGVHLTPSNASFTVEQQVATGAYPYEYSSFNEPGTGYIYILFR